MQSFNSDNLDPLTELRRLLPNASKDSWWKLLVAANNEIELLRDLVVRLRQALDHHHFVVMTLTNTKCEDEGCNVLSLIDEARLIQSEENSDNK